TYAYGINTSDDIAGSWVKFCNPVCQYRAFMQVSGMFRDVRYPGASMTWIYGINDLEQVAGTYVDLAGNAHGWAGAPVNSFYVTVDYPSAVSTSLTGISNRGFVVGYYSDANFVTHGFAASLR